MPEAWAGEMFSELCAQIERQEGRLCLRSILENTTLCGSSRSRRLSSMPPGVVLRVWSPARETLTRRPDLLLAENRSNRHRHSFRGNRHPPFHNDCGDVVVPRRALGELDDIGVDRLDDLG